MKIKDKVHKTKFKNLVFDAESLYFFVTNGSLPKQWQELAKRYLEFLYELDVNNEVDHGQFVFPPAYYNDDALKIHNKIMEKITGVKKKRVKQKSSERRMCKGWQQ